MKAEIIKQLNELFLSYGQKEINSEEFDVLESWGEAELSSYHIQCVLSLKYGFTPFYRFKQPSKV